MPNGGLSTESSTYASEIVIFGTNCKLWLVLLLDAKGYLSKERSECNVNTQFTTFSSTRCNQLQKVTYILLNERTIVRTAGSARGSICFWCRLFKI